MSGLYSISIVHDLQKPLSYQINNHRCINMFQSGLQMFHLFAGLVDMDDLVKHRHRHKNTNISLSKELPDLQPFASNIKACFLFIGSTTPWYVCVVIFSIAFIDDWKNCSYDLEGSSTPDLPARSTKALILHRTIKWSLQEHISMSCGVVFLT